MRLGNASAAIVFAVLGWVTLIGCGGNAPPAATPAPTEPTTKNGGPAETFPEVQPADLAELDALRAGKTPSNADAAGPKDECTPIGVDFEKRARPKLKDCYAAGKKKDPNLEGTVKIAVAIDTVGKVKSHKITEKTLPDAVAQCMLKALKATALPEASKCPGKTLTIPVTFPTPP